MHMKKLLIISITTILLIGCGEENKQQMGAPEIPVYKTKTERVPIYQEFVGEVFGLKDIKEIEAIAKKILYVVGREYNLNGNLVKVVGWYDNEYGYSCRVVDLIKKVS